MRFSLSGDPEALGGLILPLILHTDEGKIPVTPSIISRSSPDQIILFEDVEANDFVQSRAREIGCSQNVVKLLARGKVKRRFSPDIIAVDRFS
ncbi:MAG: hypothetical protein OEQ53_19565 [Saprospiraceae bacterium]|nr:hypothetical protein [Saprospiraceae bacterium]